MNLGTLDPWRLNLWSRPNGRAVQLYRTAETSPLVKCSLSVHLEPSRKTLRSGFHGPVPKSPLLSEEENDSGIKYFLEESDCDEEFSPAKLLSERDPMSWVLAALSLRRMADSEFSRWSKVYNDLIQELME